MDKIFAIIVTFNGMQHNWIQKCLDSLLFSSIQTKIIVIDNGSVDGTIDFIQKNYSQVDLIVLNENLGFAKANNVGIKKAYEQGADYFLLLNQDAWLEKNTIEKLVEAFKQLPEAGIVSPIHLNGNKTNLDSGFINYIAQHNTPDFVSDSYLGCLKNVYETKFVNAAAWLISRGCIDKIGGFDTSIFYHYGEDDNYCQRVAYHGFKIYIITTTAICHDRSERKGKWTTEHQKRGEEVWICTYYGDILKEDKLINDIISKLRKKLSIQVLIKSIIKLQFRKNSILRKKTIKDLDLYLKIESSRKQNKKTGLNWL